MKYQLSFLSEIFSKRHQTPCDIQPGLPYLSYAFDQNKLADTFEKGTCGLYAEQNLTHTSVCMHNILYYTINVLIGIGPVLNTITKAHNVSLKHIRRLKKLPPSSSLIILDRFIWLELV